MKSDDTQAGTEIFCAHNFVKELLQKGCETSCDETNNNFNRKLKLPAYFDLDKFKRYQIKFKLIDNLDPFTFKLDNLNYAADGIPLVSSMDIISYLVLTQRNKPSKALVLSGETTSQGRSTISSFRRLSPDYLSFATIIFYSQIMPEYTNAEITDMHFMYGCANGKAAEAQCMYGEAFPNWLLSSDKFFQDFMTGCPKLVHLTLMEILVDFDQFLFPQGQQFFHKHIWAMFFSKIMGLVTILCVPELSDVLMFTKMSHVPLLAYKRYLQTIFHMYIWYNEDFCTESKIWKSICKVRFKHNQASQRSRSSTKIFISQKNMAVTQFGFMGFAVWRTKLVGIHEVEEDELEAFIHFWKVIGHLMGIEDRFNICRDSVEETREICNELAVQIFKPEILKKHQNFLDLSYALLTGMWCMMPLFQYKAFIQLTANIITSSTPSTNSKIHKDNNKNYIENLSESVDFELNAFENFYLKSILLFLSLFRFTIIRVFHRYVIYISIWLMENFPFLAYYKFGKANSHVKILD